jgi:hypothetical protein
MVLLTAPLAPGQYDVRLFANNGYTRLATSGAITVDTQPSLSINDVSVTEGHAGQHNATFTVTLAPAHPTQTVAVQYATADGSAMQPSDYSPQSGQLTFAPGMTTRTIAISVNGDTTLEASEWFSVHLSSPTNAAIGDGEGRGTIVNDEGPPAPQLTVPASIVAGSTITVTVENGPAKVTDWIGVFAAGAGDGAHMDWVYLSGTQVPPASGRASATMTIRGPAAPGTYQVRFFTNGYTRLAVSAIITVTP